MSAEVTDGGIETAMRRIVCLVALVALAAAGFALAGCTLLGSPIDDTNAAIDAANVHFRAYGVSVDKVAKFATDLNSISATAPAEAGKAIDLAAQILKEYEVQRTELNAGSTEMAKVKTFDVDASYKKYADMEIAFIDAQIAVVDEGVKLYTELQRYYAAVKDDTLTKQLSGEILTKIDSSSQSLGELTKAASAARDAADKQFDITSQE
jgi:hypothetical protein